MKNEHNDEEGQVETGTEDSKPMKRRDFITTGLTIAAAAKLGIYPDEAQAAEYKFDPSTDIIQAPDDPALWPQFRQQLVAWREAERKELGYSDALYRRPDFAWVPASFACYFLMLNDERFCDAAGAFHVAKWLEGVRRDVGGCDSVVLWHAYPRIGLDERNQYDFYRNQPGGLPRLRALVDEFHRAGVRSYINYNPWDIHTRREAKSDVDTLCDMVAALGVDGVFLDTMKEGAAEFRAKLDAVRPGVVLEGEVSIPMERIADHHMGWAQGFKDSAVPGVVRSKWFERRHQLHHVQRWGHDRTPYFQAAWMNGTGTMLWDNVFGSWVGYSPREKSFLRSMLPIQRRFSALFSGEGWTPLVPVNGAGVYASGWEGAGIRVWTLVNRNETDAEASLPNIELKPGEHLYDAISGSKIKNASATIRARGIGCFVAAHLNALGKDFPQFLEQQRAIEQSANWDASFPTEVQTSLRPVAKTPLYAPDQVPPDMATIAGGPFHLDVLFRLRECAWYESDPNSIERWGHSLHQFRNLQSEVILSPYAMDLTPVTNVQFAAFLGASNYKPGDTTNFLKHWQNGAPQAEQEDHPVVYVDLEDARAYAKWAGKRLPTEAEWQFAAQGNDGRKYPWGNEEPETGGELCNGSKLESTGGSTPVKQFPAGRSPFGIYDLCGNTWEWTESERRDGVNRFAMLRGGSWYQARKGNWSWYMDGGPQPANFSCKYLLQYPGLDRCATLGFRCVADLQRPATALLPLDGKALTYVGPGNTATVAQIVPVRGPGFSQALQVNTLDVVKPSSGDYGLYGRLIAGAKKGDVLWLSFQARALEARRESGEASFALRLDQLVDGKYQWPPYLERGISVGREWTQFHIPYQMERDVTPETMRLSLGFDHYPQNFELGPVTFLNFGSELKTTDLPRSVVSYGGFEPDSPWRKIAAQNTEKYRKGDLRLKVLDKNGQALAGAEVAVHMTRLDFLIGTAVNTSNVLDAPDAPKYRETLAKYFNHMVFDNQMKWPQWAGKNFDPAPLLRVLDWAKTQGITARGHCFVWPSWGHLPAYLKDFQGDKVALRREILGHIAQQTKAMKGRFVSWDVTNELFAHHDLIDILGRDEIAAWYQAAHAGDPETKLFYNEYTMFHAEGKGTDHCYDTVEFLLEKGAPVQGLGEQAHIGGAPPAIPLVLERLTRFGALGLPILLTEFDVSSNDEEFQANYLRDFMTAVFSHPATVGIVQWGFWEGSHWVANAALWNRDWSLRKHGQVFVDKVTKEWRTDASGQTDGRGAFQTRAFYGDYEATITHAGKSQTMPLQLRPNGAEQMITLT